MSTDITCGPNANVNQDGQNAVTDPSGGDAAISCATQSENLQLAEVATGERRAANVDADFVRPSATAIDAANGQTELSTAKATMWTMQAPTALSLMATLLLGLAFSFSMRRKGKG